MNGPRKHSCFNVRNQRRRYSFHRRKFIEGIQDAAFRRAIVLNGLHRVVQILLGHRHARRQQRTAQPARQRLRRGIIQIQLAARIGEHASQSILNQLAALVQLRLALDLGTHQDFLCVPAIC